MLQEDVPNVKMMVSDLTFVLKFKYQLDTDLQDINDKGEGLVSIGNLSANVSGSPNAVLNEDGGGYAHKVNISEAQVST